MKRIYLVIGLLVALAVQQGFSQVMAGGSVSFLSRTSEYMDTTYYFPVKAKYSSLTFNPFVGYRFGIASLGASISYTGTWIPSQNGMTNDAKSTLFGIGIFGDFNFLSLGRLTILARGTLQYSSFTGNGILISVPNISTPNNTVSNLKTVGLRIVPIIEYRIVNNFGVYVSLDSASFSFSRSWSNDRNLSQNNFNFSLPLSSMVKLTDIAFGVCFFF